MSTIADLFAVDGAVTIVTGAASGIGLAYSEVMAENGAIVVMTDIDAERLESEAARLRDAGARVEGRILDVTDRQAIVTVFDAVAETYGRIDVVFANAGIDAGPGFIGMDGERNPLGAVDALSDEHWDRIIAADLTSVFSTIKSAVRLMRPRRSGRIIVTTSVAALKTEAIVSTPYMPAKAGAAHLVRQLAFELAGDNILINAIAPGPFVTNIAGGHLHRPEVQAAFARLSPLGRLATTKEIQGAAIFLASSAGSYVTGTQIVVDGGVLLGPGFRS
jgi:NAD(P)-dependent dehydrogenase (short-subunit alcohol dehydrogenase family)